MTPTLPLDIWIDICAFLDAIELAKLQLVNRICREAACLPTIWEREYKLKGYTVSDPARESLRRKSDDYRTLFMERARLDREALVEIDDIVFCRGSRADLASSLVNKAGDIWNALEGLSVIHTPSVDDKTSVGPTRAFWAKHALGAIGRRHALLTWQKLSRSNRAVEGDLSLEDALGGLSCFFNVHPDQLKSQLDSIAAACRVYIEEHSISITFDTQEGIQRLCQGICTALREQGFVAVDRENYHNISNHFPHLVLTTNRATLPLSLVYVFCAICSRFRIDAGAVNFPGRVMAHVQPPSPDIKPFYVDVYSATDSTAAVIEPQELDFMLNVFIDNMAFDPASARNFMDRASPSAMLRRCRRNIGSSTHELAIEPNMRQYVTYIIGALFEPGPGDVGRLLPIVGSLFPLDIKPVILDTLGPLLPKDLQAITIEFCEDLLATAVEEKHTRFKRSHQTKNMKYGIGQLLLMKNNPQNIFGCVLEWTPSFAISEDDFTDPMPEKGTDQPFYLIATSAGHRRYIAEEDANLLNVTPGYFDQFLRRGYKFERYFCNAVFADPAAGTHGYFVMSPEHRMKYPEEAEFLLNK